MRVAPQHLFAAVVVAGCLGHTQVPDPPVSPTDGPLGSEGTGAFGPDVGLESVASMDAPGGYALRVWEDRAYVATFTTEEGVAIFNVSDPRTPTHVGGIVGTLARSVDVLDYGDRVAVAISTGEDLKVFDVTDLREPLELAALGFPSHNVAVHREARVIYNARNLWDGVGGAVEIVNASDPDDVHLDHVFTFPLLAKDGTHVHNQGCHDLTIHPETARAYCAAYEQTLVWDIGDPYHPVILTAITNPLVTSHHTAFPILNHTVLVVGDEFVDNFAWGCLGHPVQGAPQAPAGGLWFYDLTTPSPQVLGRIEAPPTPPDEPAVLVPLTGAMCTSHDGVELGPGTGVIAYGWFHAGVVLVDARDPSVPVLLDRDDVGGAVGDAAWHRGHVLAVDDGVGLTVLAPSG